MSVVTAPNKVVSKVTVLAYKMLLKFTGYGPDSMFIDQAVITEFEDGSLGVETYYTVNGEHPMIKDHFKNEPLMPGCLFIEMAAQAAYLGALRKQLVRPKMIRPTDYEAKMGEEAYPGDRLVTVCHIPTSIRARAIKSKDRKGIERLIDVFNQPVCVSLSLAEESWGGSRVPVATVTIRAVGKREVKITSGEAEQRLAA